MADSARAALRERLRLRTVIVWVVLVAALWWVQDRSLVGLGTGLATATVLGLSQIGAEVYNLRSEVESLGLGLVTLLSSIVLFVMGNEGASAGLLLVGGWIVADTVQTLRHEGFTNDESHESRDGHAVYHDYVVRRVHEMLRERPLTRLELSKTLDADGVAIDRALETLTERGVLSRNGSELRVLSPSKPGPIGRARNGLVTALRRLARPVTIEFERDAAADEIDARHRSVGTTRNDDTEREREPTRRH